MKVVFTFCLVVWALLVEAQYRRQAEPVYIPGTAYRNTGWFISPGITYMLPTDRRESLTMYLEQPDGTDGLDTLYSGDYNRGGKIGVYLEAGRHKFITDRVLIKHLDYGIHFKMLRGREDFTGVTNAAGTFVPVSSPSKYSDSYVGAFFNASSFIQLSDRHWIQNSLGANVDVRVITRHVSGMPYGSDWQYPGVFFSQFHYKLGFGWKPEPGIYIIPSIETPILNVFPWDDGKSTLKYYTGWNRPFILTLKIQWLSKASNRKCEGQPGSAPDLDKAGKHEKNDLWGPQDKKMKRKRRNK